MNIERLKKNPTLFRRFVGISLDRFEHLVVSLQKIYSKHEKKNVYTETDRLRCIGGGPQF